MKRNHLTGLDLCIAAAVAAVLTWGPKIAVVVKIRRPRKED